MYCKNCGKELKPGQDICLECGFKKGTGKDYCPNCGEKIKNQGQAVCLSCGAKLSSSSGSLDLENGDWVPSGKSKMVCMLLALLLGGIGAQNFYLGETKKGVLKIILMLVVGLGWILSIVDLVKMAINKYEVNPDVWF